MARDRHDKIFDNSFESAEFELDTNISFNVSPQYSDDRPEEDKITQKILQEKIHELIEASRFKKFNELDEFSDSRKLRKNDINDVYDYVLGELLKNYSRIDVFSELCDYFNLHPTKFYNSLSNVFKEGLIEELDDRTGVLSKKNINRLF
mgnify:FL=1|jgi:hypothetical protein